MKQFAAVLFVAVVSLAASADPKVVSIFPQIGTVSGGDFVTIVVDTPLKPCIICSPPTFLAEVTFDGIRATEVSASATTIRARTPAHKFGNVDVVVTSQETPYGTTRFRYAGWGGPIDISNYEKVLIPLSLSPGRTLPGAFGSLWTTELWLRNDADAAVEFFQDITCTLSCPQFLVPEPPYPQVPKRSTQRVSTVDAGGNVAYLYYLQRSYGDNVHFSLHAADVSRSNENAGTEIGVVRARDFGGRSFDILNVRIDASSRATLRLYDADAITGSSAHVTLLSMDDNVNTILGEKDVALPVPVKKPATTLADVVPAFAGYGEIADLRGAFPGLSGNVRIHVDMYGSDHGWAFVSVTNNATQLITTYRPE